MSEARNIYPPTCLLCRHFWWQEQKRWSEHTWQDAAFLCAKGHEIDEPKDMGRAATCQGFDEVTAADREGLS